MFWMNDHEWVYVGGRSRCATCGRWANDLRCVPEFRLSGGRYPTITDLQHHYACGICGENILTRMVNGELRAICLNGHDVLETRRITQKNARDHRWAQEAMDYVEVLDDLPAELRALAEKER
jgi:hypothetical protein